MNEDRELVDFARRRLEEDVPGDVPRMEAIMRAAEAESFALASGRRLRRRRWTASLVAASAAAACVFAVSLFRPPDRSEVAVADVIDLLRAADGIDASDRADSVAEMLLAWQDAPYESAVADALSSN